MQSNFGVVTKMGLWPMPRPEVCRAVWIHCETDEGGYQLLDAGRPLLMDRTITSRVTIMTLIAVVPTQTVQADWHPETTPVTDEIRAVMQSGSDWATGTPGSASDQAFCRALMACITRSVTSSMPPIPSTRVRMPRSAYLATTASVCSW